MESYVFIIVMLKFVDLFNIFVQVSCGKFSLIFYKRNLMIY